MILTPWEQVGQVSIQVKGVFYHRLSLGNVCAGHPSLLGPDRLPGQGRTRQVWRGGEVVLLPAARLLVSQYQGVGREGGVLQGRRCG